jgi:general secretion pathway protein I
MIQPPPPPAATREDGQKGFTLLEVMVAIAILGLALTAIFSSEAGAIKTAHRARKMQVATLLARCKMGELEEQLLEEGFPAIESRGSDECCEDAEQEGFECTWAVRRIELPVPGEIEDSEGLDGSLLAEQRGENEDDDPTRAPTLEDAQGLGLGSTVDGLLGGAGSMSGDMMGELALTYAYPILKPNLEERVRRVDLTVRWAEGEAEKTFELARFVVAEPGQVAPPPELGSTDLSGGAGEEGGGNP